MVTFDPVNPVNKRVPAAHGPAGSRQALGRQLEDQGGKFLGLRSDQFVTLGLAGWITACQGPCQKGWLIVRYDGQGRVVDAQESYLPDDHPLVADCAGSAVRGEVAVCQGVRDKVRPSSLPKDVQTGRQ